MNSAALSVVLLGTFAALAAPRAAEAQPADANYDESKIPDYVLPELLTLEDGTTVTTPEQWRAGRRPEVLRLFEEYVYGKTPGGRPEGLAWEVRSTDEGALDSRATRKQIRIRFDGTDRGSSMDLLLYTPNDVDGPAPVILGLNFKGNHTISDDPGIDLPEGADEADRGIQASRWPVEAIVGRGYGLATAHYFDIDPDVKDEWSDGVHPLFYGAGQDRPLPDQWGAIGAWAWGLSRALDYLETDPDVDADRVAVFGHSRLGKTSLWAGAQDERFALVISNDSGCGGAALSRRRIGETVERINTSFPHWFADTFNQYNGNEDALPVDQHMLIALAAPRPVLVLSAEGDRWADPRGEFLSAFHASPVYRLFGLEGIGDDAEPPLNTPVGGAVTYHIRPGGHDVTMRDWRVIMDFADAQIPIAAD